MTHEECIGVPLNDFIEKLCTYPDSALVGHEEKKEEEVPPPVPDTDGEEVVE
jgi:hypothetical protein